MIKELPTIIVDTRETLPFKFDGYQTKRAKLDAGDYSLLGFTDCVGVERKSHEDAWGSMGIGRSRFHRCVQRLAELDRAAIVIECSLSRLCERPYYADGRQITVASVIGGFISYSAHYAIPVFFCDNRAMAERVTLRFLASWYKHRAGKVKQPELVELDEDGTAVF